MKTILWSALLAGGLLLGGAAGVNAAPAATGSAIEAALADVSLLQEVRRCRCLKWKCKPRPSHYCPPPRKYKPKPKPKY
jgi:hypothetical protein